VQRALGLLGYSYANTFQDVRNCLALALYVTCMHALKYTETTERDGGVVRQLTQFLYKTHTHMQIYDTLASEA